MTYTCIRAAARRVAPPEMGASGRRSLFSNLDTLVHGSAPPLTGFSATILKPILRAWSSRTPALYQVLRARSIMADRPLFIPSFAPEKFGPRTGTIEIDRGDGTPVIQINTPGLLTATSRGLVPHLSGDHVHLTGAIRHIQLPFESL